MNIVNPEERSIPLENMENIPVSHVEPPKPPRATRHLAVKATKSSRRGDPNYQQINAYVPKDIHRAVKIELVKDDDREMSDLLEELLLAWLKKKGTAI
jgi:hypothetical protein